MADQPFNSSSFDGVESGDYDSRFDAERHAAYASHAGHGAEDEDTAMTDVFIKEEDMSEVEDDRNIHNAHRFVAFGNPTNNVQPLPAARQTSSAWDSVPDDVKMLANSHAENTRRIQARQEEFENRMLVKAEGIFTFDPTTEQNAEQSTLSSDMIDPRLLGEISDHHGSPVQQAGRAELQQTINERSDFVVADNFNQSSAQGNPAPYSPTFGHANREKADPIPAYSAKISYKLGPADKLMIELREQGCNNKKIADMLVENGYTKYDQKTISTRIVRIKEAQAKQVERDLASGAKEWTDAEDAHLMRALDETSFEVAYMLEQARAWHFKKAAEWMGRMDKNVVFSGPACEARYAVLAHRAGVLSQAREEEAALRLPDHSLREEQTTLEEKEKQEGKQLRRMKSLAHAAGLRAQAEEANSLEEAAIQRADFLRKEARKAQEALSPEEQGYFDSIL